MPQNVEMPSSKQFRDAVAKLLIDNVAVIAQRIGAEFLDDRGVTIESYFTGNIDSGTLPLVMVEQRSLTSKWVAMPSLMRLEFRATLHGVVWHDDPEVLDSMSSGLEAGVRDVLNRRHLRAPLTADLEMFFDDVTPPIGEARFGGLMVNSVICRGFECDFLAKAEVGVPPIYPA